jgi:hypothetical protein
MSSRSLAHHIMATAGAAPECNEYNAPLLLVYVTFAFIAELQRNV